MSKIGQHILDMPYEETPDPDMEQDPEYKAWADSMDEEDIEIQDHEQEEF